MKFKTRIGTALLALAVVVLIATPAAAQPAMSGSYFLPAVNHCVAVGSVAAPIVTRVAANDWALVRTAAGAETISYRCDLSSALMSRGLLNPTAGGGIRITSIGISQKITVAALTSNTLNAVSKTTYATTAANAVAAFGGTLAGTTLPTATAAQPVITTVTLGTPAYLTGTAAIGVDATVVMANTGVWQLNGIVVNYVKSPGTLR